MTIKHLLMTIDEDKADIMGNIPLEAPATEVVRCGECIHFRDIAWYDGSVKHRCSGVFTFIEPDPEGFCAWGRKGEE